MPKVWLDLDQAALDDAYDQPAFAPNFHSVAGRMARASAEMRQRRGDPKYFQYGPSPIERIHYYPADLPDAPLHIHVHGGAWRQRPAGDSAFPAEMFNNAGAGFAVFDFISVDETAGDLRPMREQTCRALAWFARHAIDLGGDPERLYLSGFSSGAHLASVALLTDGPAALDPVRSYKSAILISGMYDLKPVRLSKRSEYVRFTDEVEREMSPLRHLDRFDIPTVLTHGTLETPEFQRQTRDFWSALQACGKPVQLLVEEGFNHLEMMEMFGNPYSALGRAALGQIRRRSEA